MKSCWKLIISQLICKRHTSKRNDAIRKMISNKVTLNLNMFCVLMKGVIVFHLDGNFIIATNGSTQYLKDTYVNQ